MKDIHTVVLKKKLNVTIYHRASYFTVSLSKYFTSTSKSLAILPRVSKFGWTVFLHHLLTVQVDLPNCSASHFPVLSFSTRTNFSRLRFDICSKLDIFNFDAKLLKFHDDYVSFMKKLLFSFHFTDWSLSSTYFELSFAPGFFLYTNPSPPGK